VVLPPPAKSQAMPIPGAALVTEPCGDCAAAVDHVAQCSHGALPEHGLLSPPHQPGEPGHMQYTRQK